MKIHVMTLFPEIFEALNSSILKKAMEKELLKVEAVNIRDYTNDKHGKVDDYPYGGGAGMLMQAQPIYDAYQDIVAKSHPNKKIRTLYMTPQGVPFHQKLAKELSREEELIFLCGHYEGVDERVLEEIVTDYVSIGDYVLTGGELPAMVMIDAIARFVPEVLHNDVSAETESFHRDLLEYPQYSRPEVWKGKEVPRVLLSGDHKRINQWRLEEAQKRTRERRPDLYQKYKHSQEWISRLRKKKRKNIALMETLYGGMGQILWETPDYSGLVLKNETLGEVYAYGALDPQAEDILYLEAMQGMQVVCSETGIEGIEGVFAQKGQEYTKNSGYRVCYTRKETLPLKYKDMRRSDGENGLSYGFTCSLEGEEVGYVGGRYPGRVDMVYVKEGHRNKGIGSALLSRFVNEALVDEWTVFTLADEGMMQVLTEKLGFVADDEKTWCFALKTVKKCLQ